jgi:hypothetical protein
MLTFRLYLCLTYCAVNMLRVVKMWETNIEWGDRGAVQYNFKTQVY